MTSVFCVRAEFGTYAKRFIDGGYIAIGWLPEVDLSDITTRDEIYPLYRNAYPQDVSAIVIGQQVGQIGRFLLEIQAGDYVVTPDSNTEWLHVGTVVPDPSYFYATTEDGCPFPHRRRVDWLPERLRRADLSVPLQHTFRSSLTVFQAWEPSDFFEAIGKGDLGAVPAAEPYNAEAVVLEQVLRLDPTEFEILITHLLTALGFEAEHVGKVGDGGVDAMGELSIANLAKVKLFVQAKRYQRGSKVSANTVKQLRQSIPFGGQGAFITTADYQAAAADIAVEQGFPRIGLINGRQLVDLLVEHWQDIPSEFRGRLGLRRGLVLS